VPATADVRRSFALEALRERADDSSSDERHGGGRIYRALW
jgi:hypothetical protein